MKTKRVMSLLLSFALVLSSVTGIYGKSAHAEETEKKIVIYVAAEGKNANGDEVEIYKTPVQITAGMYAEKAVKEVLDYYYKDQYEYQNAFLSSIGKVANTDKESWMFHVNGEEPHEGETWYSIADYPVKDQDRISLVYGEWGNLPPECASYQKDASFTIAADAQAALLERATKQKELMAKKIFDTTFQGGTYVPGITDTDSLYDVFSLVQSGFQADDFYDAVASRVISDLKKLGSGKTIPTADGKTSYTLKTYEDNKYVIINYTKIAMLLAALGQDITDAAGMDLTKKITDRKNFEKANATSLTRESLILFVMNGTGAEWPDGDYVTEEEMVKGIVDDLDNQIQFSTNWENAWGATLDSAAMAIQALAPYALTPVPESEGGVSTVLSQELQEKVNRVLTMLSIMQGNDGGYDKINPNNPWVLAQVLLTTGLYEKNPVQDTDVIRNGKTLFDAATQFVDVEKNTVDAALMGYAPAQMLRGLTSGLRAAEGEAGLYDLDTPSYQAKLTEIAEPDEPKSEDNACTKIKAAKNTKIYVVKKGNTKKITFTVTAENPKKKTTDSISVTVKNPKLASATGELSKGKAVVTVKGKKKGKTTLTVKVGKKSAKVKIQVKK